MNGIFSLMMNSLCWLLSTIGGILARRLTGPRQVLVLAPGRDIIQSNDEFVSIGTEAQFEIADAGGTFPPGWYLCDLSVSNNDVTLLPRLLIDDGTRTANEKFAPVPPGGSTSKRFIFIPGIPKSVRLAVADRAGCVGKLVLSVRRCHRLAIIGFFLSEYRERIPRLLATIRRDGIRAGRALIATTFLERREFYDDWIRLYDTPREEEVAAIRRDIESFQVRPKFSVIMPVYNTDPRWLELAIQSVQAQVYPDWELCIADDASTRADTRAMLERLKAAEPRIKVTYRETNGHISAASNSALSIATGDYIVILDHDDEFALYALYWVAKEIEAHPDADLIYSDFDLIDQNGKRFGAYFKPDWSPSLILSQNVFCHLGAYRRALVEKVGGFRPGYEGSQDHDLVLRCSEHTDKERIRHIPRILYHWRAIPESTAGAGLEGKPYAWEAGRRAIADHLRRQGIDADVDHASNIFYQVKYNYERDGLPKVTILMPSGQHHPEFEKCINAVLSTTTYPNFELLIMIMEKRSKSERSRRFRASVADDPRVRVLIYPDQEFSYSNVNTWGVEQATGEVLCFLNDDIRPITHGWLENLVVRLSLPKVGVVGALLFYPNGNVQHAGTIIGLGGVSLNAHVNAPPGADVCRGRGWLEQDYSSVTAGCMVMRRNLYLEMGGFDPELAMAYQDVDLCLRLGTKGYRALYTPTARLHHHESATVGPPESPERLAQFEREVALFTKRWGQLLDCDPYYNPNFGRNSAEAFELAFPPRVTAPGTARQTSPISDQGTLTSFAPAAIPSAS